MTLLHVATRLTVAFACLLCAPLAEATPRIAIIIDDLGYQLAAGRRAIQLPGPISFAILPDTPRGAVLAEAAHRAGKEVLLHLPLQPVERDGPVEPGGITLDMDRSAFDRAFAEALASVPNAIGVSSHQGSLLTRHPGHMHWLMQEIAARNGLFFIDSYTTAASVAMQMAEETGVAARRRDIFLDNDRSEAALERQFDRLLAIAHRRGIAVGIAHPYPETLTFLERRLKELDEDTVKLISVSEALPQIERTAKMTF